jgi:hypothetical protein
MELEMFLLGNLPVPAALLTLVRSVVRYAIGDFGGHP